MASKQIITALCLATILQFINCSTETEKRNRCDIKCRSGGKPVCALNGQCYQTFDNACLVKLENCQNPENNQFTIVRQGPCDQTDQPNCSDTELDPEPECICMTRSYWNQCCTQVRQLNDDDTDYVVTCRGEDKQCTNAQPNQII